MIETLPEGFSGPFSPFFLLNVLTWGVPFFGFYLGVSLRHLAFGHVNSPRFIQRFAVALPVSLMLISSFNALLKEIGEPSIGSIFFVTGFIIEQGLLLDIGLAKFLDEQTNKS